MFGRAEIRFCSNDFCLTIVNATLLLTTGEEECEVCIFDASQIPQEVILSLTGVHIEIGEQVVVSGYRELGNLYERCEVYFVPLG